MLERMLDKSNYYQKKIGLGFDESIHKHPNQSLEIGMIKYNKYFVHESTYNPSLKSHHLRHASNLENSFKSSNYKI